jgi:predicted O-methyltransferase YrrM
MEIVNPAIEQYTTSLLAADDEPVLLEMERVAEESGFPIIGRLCGRYIEVQARMIGAKRIFELGSGYGYSAYWFSRAMGAEGEIHLTDFDPGNRDSAMDFLTRAGLVDPVTYHVGDALESFATVDGEFDIVFCDINKDGYPDAWRAARDRVRVGGLFIIDNVLGGGIVTGQVDESNKHFEVWAEAIRETNRMIFSDPDYRATLNPSRDGVTIAHRVR